uniref:Accessory gland-specific peptide 57Db n=2 Tax=Drosophila melanogaster TaxID=7227 RepID=MS57B_DROME|nr:Male-specific RNA 57Db [Drosophila melanogaster]Q9VBL7.1 RecName: Full=Accessory gland-specific peptide 57Db; AltName: Full=Male accessory gland secretory protein 57Db; Flags: Precursor [Drosophila melanogaster]AAF56514.1 Male-specific RNA 57Db [Drosophila melanogaster]|eukprot:NP_524499.2 Male-specific RNA 57Db [Drosophila melanogaster]
MKITSALVLLFAGVAFAQSADPNTNENKNVIHINSPSAAK